VIAAMGRSKTQAMRTRRKPRERRAERPPVSPGGDTSFDPLFVTDHLDGHPTEIRPVACRLFGLATEELSRRAPIDLLAPEDMPHVAAVVADLARGEAYEASVRVLEKGIRTWPSLLRFERLFDGRTQWSARPQTPHDRQTRALYDTLTDAFIQVDGHQTISSWNHGAQEVFGYAMHEVLGEPVEILVPPWLRNAYRRHVERMAQTGASLRRVSQWGAPIYCRHKDGHDFPAETAVVVLDLQGEPVLTLAIRDVTARWSHRNGHLLLGRLGDVLDTTSSTDHRVEAVGRLLCEGLADACFIQLVGPDGTVKPRVLARDPSRAALCVRLERELLAGRPAATTAVARRPLLLSSLAPNSLQGHDGEAAKVLQTLHELEPYWVMGLPLEARGRDLGFLWILSRTPDRYGPEELLLGETIARRVALSLDNAALLDESRRALVARDSVLSMVTHDLRSPLQTILAASTVARQRSTGGPRVDHAMGTIQRTVERMSRLVGDLFDVATMNHGGFAILPSALPCAALLIAALEAHRPAAALARIDLACEANLALPDVWGDRDQLLRVLDNLASNAMRHTSPGGRIVLSATQDGQSVRFSVRDTGSGIAREDLPHVFNRFWQGERAGKHGAGLGLAIARGIVQAHGGSIDVQSRVGEGAEFSFTVPLARQAADDPPHRPAQASR
jgi:PAS domain S-box-containing protein